MIKVSVIVPVYNTEKYLPKCLDSLIAQTLKDIEIICINDASTDGSFQILQEYASQDNRIKIIDFKKNEGVSIARNTGIDTATGEYIGFVDSDDFIDLDFYEKLYNKAIETGADAVKGNVLEYDEKIGKTELTFFYDQNEKIRKNTAYFLYGFTSAIYKTDFILRNKIYFPENITHFEDPYFSIGVTLQTDNIITLDDAKYFYVRHQNSTVGKCKTLEKTIDFTRSTKLILNKVNCSNPVKKKYMIYFNFLLEQLLPWCWALGLKDEANIVAIQAIYDLGNMAKFDIVDLLVYHFLNKKEEQKKLFIKNLRRNITYAKG